MKVKTYKKVTPPPFFELNMSCSSRAMYDVLSKMEEVRLRVGEEDEYIQKCDYEGDLNRIEVYQSKELKIELAKEFGVGVYEDKLDMEWHFVDMSIG